MASKRLRKYKVHKDLSATDRITVTVKLDKTNHTYFSVIYESKNRLGSSKELILEHFPELADAVALHLCDVDGTPIHAYANGKYYLEHPEQYDDSVIANHFRISIDDVYILRNKTPEQLREWIEGEKPRWQKEADAVIAKYNLAIPQ